MILSKIRGEPTHERGERVVVDITATVLPFYGLAPGYPEAEPQADTVTAGVSDRRQLLLEVPIERRPGNPQGLADLPDGVRSSPARLRSCLTCWAVNTLGLPNSRPRARAACSPAWVRSLMRSRSNSASAPKTWKTSLPTLVVVSVCSWRERKPTPRFCSCLTVLMRWARERPSRSSRQTTRVSP